MGNSQSPPANPRFASASRAFTQKELDDLKSLFRSLTDKSKRGDQFISLPIFQEYFGLNGPLAEKMFDLVTQQRKDDKLNYEDLVIAKATYEKGTNNEIEEFIYQLLDVTNDGILTRSDLEAVLVTLLESLFSVKNSQWGLSSYKDTVDEFLNAATFSSDDKGCGEKSMSFEDFRSWCAHVPSVRKFLGSLLVPLNHGRPGSQAPQLIHSEDIDPSSLLLRTEYAWHIGGALPLQELEQWKLLYHSSLNGLSFNTFFGNISNDQGPTVLVIKDKEGYVYGGYASQPWERHGDYYGDMKSFLFQLYPKAAIFRPTGANNNLQWCAVNFSSDSIPNGIGFGGRINHFGLFISANLDQGHTLSCTTFGSPCLSKTNQIYPDVIECWGVVQNGKQEDRVDNAVKGTVLQRFKEDRHMLNMVGLANSSE